MQLRTFIAENMRDALAQMRREMGPEAVIVSSQRARGGGVMVRAAFDAPAANNDEDAIVAMEQAEVSPSAAPGDFGVAYRNELIRRLRTPEGPKKSAALRFNRGELLALLRGHRAPDALAHQLAEAAEKSGLGDMTLALASALDKRMSAAPLDITQGKALLLVGPSGAGKTAVAAKIAAHARLAARAVRLVAADTAGAGAVARLETFGMHLGAETTTADCAEAIAAAIAESTASDILAIIDTAGFDPRHAKARTAFAALARLEHVEALGVVSATGDAEEIGEVVLALTTLGVKRVAVTGVDVTRRLGALLAAATQGASLAHFTRSPYVSGGLECLSPLSLARLLIEARQGGADQGSPQ